MVSDRSQVVGHLAGGLARRVRHHHRDHTPEIAPVLFPFFGSAGLGFTRRSACGYCFSLSAIQRTFSSFKASNRSRKSRGRLIDTPYGKVRPHHVPHRQHSTLRAHFLPEGRVECAVVLSTIDQLGHNDSATTRHESYLDSSLHDSARIAPCPLVVASPDERHEPIAIISHRHFGMELAGGIARRVRGSPATPFVS